MLFSTSKDYTKNLPISFCISTRFGGFSKKPYDSLNLAYHTGDDEKIVSQNRLLLKQAFLSHFHKNSTSPLLFCNQIHSNHIIDTKLLNFTESSDIDLCLGQGDGIVLHKPNAMALIMVADCNPVLLYDRTNHILVLLHAGRVGVFSGILQKGIDLLIDSYNARLDEIFMFIGASIRGCCYEVGSEIILQAKNLGFTQCVESNRLDLAECLKIQALNSGISTKNIIIENACSCCETSLYSYRREGICGRFGIVAMLDSI